MAVTNDVDELGAGLHDIRRQSVDFQISAIADNDAPGGVEHHDALTHIVQGQGQQPVFAAAVPNQQDDRPCQQSDEACGDDNKHRVLPPCVYPPGLLPSQQQFTFR